METKHLALGVAVVVGVLVGGFVVAGKTPDVVVNPVVDKVVERLGAFPGPDIFQQLTLNQGFVYGGETCRATSTTASVGTLGATGDTSLANRNVTCIDFTVNQADVTLTLAASTTGWYPTKVGQSKRLLIRNASTTATADITLAAGTGINLKGVATSSSVTNKTILGDTGADNYAIIDFIKQSDTDLDALVTIFKD